MIGLIAVSWFQGLLNGIGAILAWLYHLIPNYGVAIIVLTLAISRVRGKKMFTRHCLKCGTPFCRKELRRTSQRALGPWKGRGTTVSLSASMHAARPISRAERPRSLTAGCSNRRSPAEFTRRRF